LVSVAKRFAGGGAGGKDEVRSVQSSTGCLVDDGGLGLGPRFGVDEHHAALVWRQASVAPPGEDDDHRAKRSP
jgi:hypothetical protein